MSKDGHRIWNHLGEEAERQLAALPDVVEVINRTADTPPWQVPAGVDIILTEPAAGWRQAPATAPAGWPGTIRHFHSISAGMDVFPSWVLHCPAVTCGRGTNSAAIAEYVLAAVLEAERGLAVAFAGSGIQPADVFPAGGLEGKTLGLLGFGSIGQAVATRARAFGMEVMAYRRRPAGACETVSFASSPQAIMAAAHHVVVALPLTGETRGLIGRSLFSGARPGLHLVNIARGELIDHDALLDWLRSDPDASATLDVTEPEPLPADHPLLFHQRVRLTPHISWRGDGAAARALEIFIESFRAIAEERVPHGLVSRQNGY